MHVVLAQSGGLKCSFQVPILRELCRDRMPDLIVGNSGGALNGVMAAQGEMDALEDLWRQAGDIAPWRWKGDRWDLLEKIRLVIGGILSKSKRGLYDLSEIRSCVEDRVRLDKLKTKFACGVTVRETFSYLNLLAEDMHSDQELQRSLLASSAIAGLFYPVDMEVNGVTRTCSDAGHLHTIPLVPRRYRRRVKSLDLIMTSPLQEQQRSREEVNGLLKSVEWAMEIASMTTQIHGLRQIKFMAEQGVKIRIFAPKSHLGGIIEGADQMIEDRMQKGREALESPVEWQW